MQTDMTRNSQTDALRKTYLYLELFWSAFFPHYSPYSARMRKNVDQNNSEYGDFLRSDGLIARNSQICKVATQNS